MTFDLNKQIVDSQVKKFKNDFPEYFAGLDDERALSKAFLMRGISAYLNIDIEEAFSYITDGGNDGGFDGAFIQEQPESILKVVLFQSKYTRNLEKDSSFPTNSIEKAVNTIKTVFAPSMDMMLNSLSQAVVDEIRSYLLEGYLPDITFVCLSNGSIWNDEGNRYIANAFSGNSNVEFDFFNHNDILKTSTNNKEINTHLNLSGKALSEEFNYKRVILGKVNVMEIYRLIEEFGDALLERNIRNYLGKNNVNLAISDTLINQNSNFFFYNNGITLIANNMRSNSLATENWIVKIDNVQIINGGQTCKTIHETILNNPDIDYRNAYVLVRIYAVDATDNDNLIKDITVATNSQNPVDLRDLQANDDVQQKLELDARDLGYVYKRKRDVTSGAGIPSSVAAESVLAIWRQQPVAAKSKKSEHFSTYYNLIFNELNASQMILAVDIYRYCDRIRKLSSEDIEINTIRRFSSYFISMIIGDVLLKTFNLKLNEIRHDNFLDLKEWLDQNIEEIYISAENYLLDSVRSQLNSYFFNSAPTINNIDGRTIASIFRSESLKSQFLTSNFNPNLNSSE
ncbi:AIPR family protein [Enterococcus sp. DIV0970a]|uniref:AIPR family protein n=1 Tax=unclassified Enterococcus TaxID=2608891 RepID=UPI003F275B2A